MADTPKILKPNQMEVPLQTQVVPFGGVLQVQLQTPEGRMLMVLVKVKDWDLVKDQFIIDVGQVDLTQAAQEGKIMGAQPKGIIGG